VSGSVVCKRDSMTAPDVTITSSSKAKGTDKSVPFQFSSQLIRGVWRLVGEVLFAGEEAQAQKTQKRRELLGVVVVCCPKKQRAPWDHGPHFSVNHARPAPSAA